MITVFDISFKNGTSMQVHSSECATISQLGMAMFGTEKPNATITIISPTPKETEAPKDVQVPEKVITPPVQPKPVPTQVKAPVATKASAK